MKVEAPRRAVTMDEVRAHRLGARVNLTHVSAYVLCSLFAAAGGMMLAAQVGVGDARVGVNYSFGGPVVAKY